MAAAPPSLDTRFYGQHKTRAALRKDAASVAERKAIDQYVKRQEYSQRFDVPAHREFMPVIAPNGHIQVDTGFFPLRGRLRPIYISVNLNTRFGWARAYPHFTVSATDALELTKQMLADLASEGRSPVHIGFDRGVEFNSAAMKAYLASQGIRYEYYDTHDLLSKSKCERFVGTVRRYLNKYVNTVSPDWVGALPALIAAYNRTPGSRTKVAPIDVTDDIAAELRGKDWMRAQPYLELLSKFTPGTVVRVAEKWNPLFSVKELVSRDQFAKQGARWTKELYTVDHIDGYRVKLVGQPRKVSPRDLQIIDDGKVEVPEKPARPAMPEALRKAKRSQRLVLARELDAVPEAPEVTKLRRTRGVVTKPKQMNQFVQPKRAVDRAKTTKEGLNEVARIVSYRGSPDDVEGMRFKTYWRGRSGRELVTPTMEPLGTFLRDGYVIAPMWKFLQRNKLEHILD